MFQASQRIPLLPLDVDVLSARILKSGSSVQLGWFLSYCRSNSDAIFMRELILSVKLERVKDY